MAAPGRDLLGNGGFFRSRRYPHRKGLPSPRFFRRDVRRFRQSPAVYQTVARANSKPRIHDERRANHLELQRSPRAPARRLKANQYAKEGSLSPANGVRLEARTDTNHPM